MMIKRPITPLYTRISHKHTKEFLQELSTLCVQAQCTVIL